MSQAQILPINQGAIGNISQQVIDGRILHNALGVRRDFSNWIKGRIEKYDFLENEDYEKKVNNFKLAKIGEPKSLDNLNKAIEYTLSIGMAKELCMVENNEKGKLTRRYFIECERKLLNELFGKTELSIEQDNTLSTVADRNPLDKLVKVWAKQTNQRFNECWRQVNANFNIESVSELPLAWIPDALKFVQERIDTQHKALPEGQAQAMLDTSDFMIDGNLNNKFYTMLQKTHENLSTVYTHVTLYRGHARNVVLSRELSALCNSAEDSVSSALHNLKSAMFNLHNAIRIRAEFEFVNTGHTKRI